MKRIQKKLKWTHKGFFILKSGHRFGFHVGCQAQVRAGMCGIADCKLRIANLRNGKEPALPLQCAICNMKSSIPPMPARTWAWHPKWHPEIRPAIQLSNSIRGPLSGPPEAREKTRASIYRAVLTVFGRKKICESGHLPAGPRDKILLQSPIYFCSTNFERQRYIFVAVCPPQETTCH
jgi:hypothetical protein